MRDESESVEIYARFFAPRQPATGSDLRLPSWTYVLAIPRRAIRVCGERPSLFDRNRSGPLFTSDKLYTIAKGDERVQRLRSVATRSLSFLVMKTPLSVLR